MAALTKKAPLSATNESTTASRYTDFLRCSESLGRTRVWMSALCRYRLCGITVAPMMPTATSVAPMGSDGTTSPRMISSNGGLASQISAM